MASNPLQMIPIAYVDDNALPEGRVVVPFELDFTDKTSITVYFGSLQGNRKLSCMKGLIFSWQGLSITDALQVSVQGSNQVYTISANANSLIGPDSLIALGQVPLYSNNPVTLIFTKTSGNPGGKGQFSVTNFQIQPLAVNAVSSNQTFVNSFAGRFGVVIPEASDYAAFYEPIGGEFVVSFNGRSGVVEPAGGDYAAFYAPINSGVTKFNTRTGDVIPEVGDYSAFYAPINSGVTEFNTRTGNVVPEVGDYAAFYAPINSGVTKFNGRVGNVVPANGDYNANQVTNAASIILNNSFSGTQQFVNLDASGEVNAAELAIAGANINTLFAPINSGVTEFNGRTGNVVPVVGDYSVAEVTGAAPIASPVFTGVVSSPEFLLPGTYNFEKFELSNGNGDCEIEMVSHTSISDSGGIKIYVPDGGGGKLRIATAPSASSYAGLIYTDAIEFNSDEITTLFTTVNGKCFNATGVYNNPTISSMALGFASNTGFLTAFGPDDATKGRMVLAGTSSNESITQQYLTFETNGQATFTGDIYSVNGVFSANVTANNVIADTSIFVGPAGVSILTDAGAPTYSPINGSIYINTSGTSGSTLYVYTGGAWHAFA